MQLPFSLPYDVAQKLTDQGGMDLLQTTLKLGEECGELSRAVLLSTKPAAGAYRHEEGSNEHIAEEIVDVMMICMSLLHLTGTSHAQMEIMLEKKFSKWAEKLQEVKS